MGNASTEISFTSHSEMVKEGAERLPVVLFTEESIDADKTVPVVNLPPMRFIGGPTK